MSDEAVVQYVGFTSGPLGREYLFTVREIDTEPREFKLTIANEAFDAHRVRFQDAPGICSRRLHQELAVFSNHPPEAHFCITDAEMEEYRGSRKQKPRDFSRRRPAEDY